MLIDIPEELLITEADNLIETITRIVYGDPTKLKDKKNPRWFQERAILCPTNEDVHMINDHMLDNLEGFITFYLLNYLLP